MGEGFQKILWIFMLLVCIFIVDTEGVRSYETKDSKMG